MQIHGSFKDIRDNTIDVLIYKSGDLVTYEIDDYLDDEHHFCFNGDEPVTITRECSDLFEPIIGATCTIKLLANIWCGDLLFSSGIGDIIVRVKRTVNGTDKLMFLGYVTPLTFSQDINMKNNVIDIQCSDILGYLDDRKLSTGSSYGTVLANATLRSFKDVLKKLEIYDDTNSTFIFPNEQYSTRLYMDSGVSAYKDLRISDNLWLGDSVDDEMNMQEILLEILKYTNSRIISVDGQSYYMISNNTNTTSSTFYYANGDSTVILPSDISVYLPIEDKSDEQVTIDDCYNVINVKCDIDTVDDVVTDPLDKDALSSDYVNKQLYMSEYVCEVDMDNLADYAWGHKYESNWEMMVQTNAPVYQDNITDYTGLWKRDWYIRYFTNPNWTFYGDYTSDVDSNGNYIRQYKAAGHMNDLYELTGAGPHNPVIHDNYNCELYPTILGWEHGKELTAVNNIEKSNIEPVPYLVIPCPETNRYKTGSASYQNMTEEWAYNYINAQLAKYETTPMVKYKSKSYVNYTPTDPTITNFLVIGGKLTMIPICDGTQQTIPNMGISYYGMSYPYSFHEFLHNKYYDGGLDSLLHLAQGEGKDDRRYYYRRYWTKSSPNQETAYQATDSTDILSSRQMTPELEALCTKEPNAPYYNRGEIWGLDTDGMYSYQIGWGNTEIDKRNTTLVDINYVPIVMCRLRIGNKYLREKQNTGDNFPDFEWTTDPTAVFAISVQPRRPDNLGDEPKDFLIGQEYPIINTVTDSMNLKDTEGMAIPITYDDKLMGDMEFEIVGPYNSVVNSQNHYYKHSTWFRSSKTWTEQNADICVLNHVHSINIKNFTIKTASNNAKNATYNEGDLLYYSEDNKKYNNPKEDIEFKIVSGLTAAEAAELNIQLGVSYNNPTQQDGYVYTPTTKPEENYVQTMYNLYSTPKKIIEYETKFGTNNITDMYRAVYNCDIMIDLDVPNFKTIIIGDEIDLKNDRIKIKTRQL